MTAKEYLKQYEKANDRVKILQQEYDWQQEMIDALRSSSDFDGMPRTRSGGRNALEDKIDRLTEKAAEVKAATIDALALRQKVFDTVIQVPDDEGKLLYKKYIELKSFEQIAVDMHYSYRHILRIHRRALYLVDDLIMSYHVM